MGDETRTGAGDRRDVELDIALAEYEHLRIARQVSFQGSAGRFNFYLIIVAGSPAALTLAAKVVPKASVWVSAPLLLAVFALGLVTFRRLVEFDYWSTYYTRGLNYVRAYFLKRAEGLNEYFVLPSSGDRPKFLEAHGLMRATGFINSVVFGMSIGLGAGTALGNNGGAGFAGGVCGFVASWLLHVAYLLLMRERFPARYERDLPPRVLRPAADTARAVRARKPFERLAKPLVRFLERVIREDQSRDDPNAVE